MNQQLQQAGYLARGGQIVDATLVPAPKQHVKKEEKALLDQQATPADWLPAKRRGHNIATVALAAKNARQIWAMLRTGKLFRVDYTQAEGACA